jgi:iron(III) transport system substrate-binding protein
MRIRRTLPGLLACAVLAALAAGCGSSAAATPSESITLYNGQHEQTTDALVDGFEKATGIHVNVRSDDEGALANQIVTEGSNSPADVVFTEDSPALEYLQEKHALAPVAKTTLARTPARFNSADGDWVGVSARVSVLIYNPSLISRAQLPTTAMAMAAARYKGKMAIAPGEVDFQPVVTSMERTYGADATVRWLKAIQANTGDDHDYPDNETIADEVNRGQVAFGMVNQYYWYRMRAELGASNIHSKIAHFAPRDPGYVLNVSGAGIIASSHHKPAAQKFLAFMVSPQGQELIAHSYSFEYLIASGAKMSTAETPLDRLQPNPITVAQLGDGSSAIALMRRAGVL